MRSRQFKLSTPDEVEVFCYEEDGVKYYTPQVMLSRLRFEILWEKYRHESD